MRPRSLSVESGLVDIVRDFLDAHRLLRRVAKRFRARTLRFDEVQALVGDGEQAVLYRLKERTHALFRERSSGIHAAVGSEELFDLAVGSLFHEAMKFRENFYQRDAYGPKVRALRVASVADAAGLLNEFEKILGGVDARLEESLGEAEALLGQTTAQFRVLLRTHAANGFVTRYLVEHADLVEDVFGESVDRILEELYGSAGAGYAQAARSYLESGFFREALSPLDAATSRGESLEEMSRLRCYAEGMRAYLEGRYAHSIERLGAWADAAPRAQEARLADLALAALSRVGQLVDRDAGADLATRAVALAERIRPFGTAARAAAGIAGQAAPAGGLS